MLLKCEEPQVLLRARLNIILKCKVVGGKLVSTGPRLLFSGERDPGDIFSLFPAGPTD